MDKDKNLKLGEALSGKEGEFSAESSSRARNRTVMLTPEITGQVRARLAQEAEGFSSPSVDPLDIGGGFESPRAGFSQHEPDADPAGAPQTVALGGPSRGAGAPAEYGAPTARGGSRESGIVWTKETPVVGFLVSYDRDENGEVFVLRSGRIMISSQSGEANTLVVHDDSVSPMHAIMRITTEGEIQVLDQLSEFGTRILRKGGGEEEQLSGEKTSVGHGDVIRFGNRSFHVCTVARNEGES